MCGTSSDGLMITAFPQSSAGNIFQVGIAIGKLNGVIRPHDADRPAEAHRPLRPQLGRHGVAEQPATFGGRVVRGVDALLHVAPRFGQHLAHLARHRVGDGFLALDQEVAHPAQHVAARRRRGARPEREAPLGRAHRRLDVGRVGIRKAPDQIVGVGRVAVLEVGAVSRRDPLAADEVAERLSHRVPS